MTGLYLGNIDPFKAMHAVVTRQSDNGIFEPQEALSVEDAVRMSAAMNTIAPPCCFIDCR